MLHVDKGLALSEQISRLLIARSALELWLHWTCICISPINQKMLLFYIFFFLSHPKCLHVCCSIVEASLCVLYSCDVVPVPLPSL